MKREDKKFNRRMKVSKVKKTKKGIKKTNSKKLGRNFMLNKRNKNQKKKIRVIFIHKQKKKQKNL